MTRIALNAMFIVCLTFLGNVVGAQETPENQSDPMDLTKFEEMVATTDFVTLTQVEELETQAQAAYRSGDCEAALPLLKDYYTKANSLSNLIRQGSEPFYGASYDEREKVNLGADLQKLVAAENTFNKLLRQRNLAWVMEADCQLQTGDREAGIASLYRALDYISLDESDTWEKARTLLWKQVEYLPK
jgi:hypothetical protein